jgi:hypothetical protein
MIIQKKKKQKTKTKAMMNYKSDESWFFSYKEEESPYFINELLISL